jgi:hypothetical protein
MPVEKPRVIHIIYCRILRVYYNVLVLCSSHIYFLCSACAFVFIFIHDFVEKILKENGRPSKTK